MLPPTVTLREPSAMHFKLTLSLILAGLAVLFVVQNVVVAEVRFLFWGFHMTLSVLMFLLFAGGLIVGWLLHSYWAYRNRALELQRAARPLRDD